MNITTRLKNQVKKKLEEVADKKYPVNMEHEPCYSYDSNKERRNAWVEGAMYTYTIVNKN